MEAVREHPIPNDVQSAFGLQHTAYERLSGGSVNQTLASEINGLPIILQQLSDVFDERVVDDFVVVTEHLRSKGWEVPSVVATKQDEPCYISENGRVWRAMTRIDANNVPTIAPSESEFCKQVGHLVGKFHIDLSDLIYSPAYVLPHFHDIDYHAIRLQDNFDQLNPEQQAVAESLLMQYQSGLSLPAGNQQLIHGDPKLGNMLFRNDRPVTLIDYDAIMHANIWLDVGDLLRSYTSEPWVKLTDLDTVVEGYYEETSPAYDFRFFKRAAQVARKVLTAELGIRYLNDIVEDCYFDWDPHVYSSREDYVWKRAKVQWSRLQDT